MEGIFCILALRDRSCRRRSTSTIRAKIARASISSLTKAKGAVKAVLNNSFRLRRSTNASLVMKSV